MKVGVDFISIRDLSHCFTFKLAVGMSASVLNLILKTEIQMLVQKNLDELTLGLLVNGFVILVSEFIEMVPGLPQNFSALACETLDKLLLRFLFEL